MAMRRNLSTRLNTIVLMMFVIANLVIFLTYFDSKQKFVDKYQYLLKIVENIKEKDKRENVPAIGVCTNCTFPGTTITVNNATLPSKSSGSSSKFNITKPASVVIPFNTTMVLTTTNAGFLDVTQNMLESVKRTGTRPNITVIAEDEPSYKALSERAKTQPGLSIMKTNSGVTTTEKLMVRTPIYNKLVNKRPAYVLSFLEKGNRVLFVDADTYWFQDPLKDVVWDFDIALHNELGLPRLKYCDGFVYYNPTSKTIKLVKEWARLLATTDKKTPDQQVLNRLVIKEKKIPGLKVKTIEASKFPDGHKYFHTEGWREKNPNNVVVHLSFVLGHDKKVEALKGQGLWLI